MTDTTQSRLTHAGPAAIADRAAPVRSVGRRSDQGAPRFAAELASESGADCGARAPCSNQTLLSAAVPQRMTTRQGCVLQGTKVVDWGEDHWSALERYTFRRLRMRWPRSVLSGDQRRTRSSRRRNFDYRHSAVTAFLALLILVPAPAWSQSATSENVVLPEILLVVDTSASMQYRLGSDEKPSCVGQDERSRWIAAREIVAGTFSGYSCSQVTLAATPDMTNPPAQTSGATECIPGVAHNISDTTEVEVGANGSYDYSGTATAAPVLKDFGPTYTSRTAAWLTVDLSSVATTDSWLSGSLTLTSLSTPASGVPQWAYLVWHDADPAAQTATDFLCDVEGPQRTVVSLPTLVPFGAGIKTTFTFSPAALLNLRTAAVGGQTSFHFAIVPGASQINGGCNHVLGTPTNQSFIWQTVGAASASERPVVSLEVGKSCPSEGPSVHTDASGSRGNDGLIDLYGAAAKFALLTFDNRMSTATDATGGWSFGATTSSDWGTINHGLADPLSAAGPPSVPITRSDTTIARGLTRSAIIGSLAAIQPAGATPLGALLEDAVAYLGPGTYKDPHFQKISDDPIAGDPYYTCRQRMVVVLTDGGANLHDSLTADGRSEAIQAAASLNADGVKVFVVAVGHPAESDSSGPTSLDLDFLDDLAAAGGTGAAIVGSTPAAVAAVLGPAIAETGTLGQVLTRPLYTTSTGLFTDIQHGFQTQSVFDVKEPLRTTGLFEQRLYSCDSQCKNALDPGAAQVCAVIDLSDRLLSRTLARRWLTHTDAILVDLSDSYLTADHLGISNLGVGHRTVRDVGGNCTTVVGAYDLTVNGDREAYRNHVLSTLKSEAGTCREGIALGAPGRAQPTLLEPASHQALRDPSWSVYANVTTPASGPYSAGNPVGSAKRPTMLFTSTHDGLLHAFRTDRDPTITLQDNLVAGDELWSFLPRFNLQRIAQLRLVSDADGSYLGGAIAARHVLLERDSSSLPNTALNWRAVVIAAAGEGGAGYAALDVTSPQAPTLLWEITPNGHCWGQGTVSSLTGPKCLNTTTFIDMGRSTARPVLAQLFFEKSSVVTERSVAIIAGGKPPNLSSVTNPGVDGNGERVVWVLDTLTGDVIRRFSAGDMVTTGITTTITDPDDLGTFWSEPACFDNGPGQITTRCFIGDSKGMLWRIDLSATDPDDWEMVWLHDAYSGTDTPATWVRALDNAERVPVLSPPSISRGFDGSLIVIYGTGGVDDAVSATRRHLVYSLTETFVLADDGTASTVTAARNWVTVLGDTEHFVGPPLVFARNAYWTTYAIASDGACTIGAAWVWGGRFDKPASVSDPTDIRGAFINPADPSSSDANLDRLTLGLFRPSPVDVLPVPACVQGCPPSDSSCILAGGGALGGARPKHEISVAVAGPVQSDSQKPKTGTQPQIGTINQAIPQPRLASVVTGWDLLLE